MNECVIDGVTYVARVDGGEDCSGCVGNHNEKLCNILASDCRNKVWLLSVKGQQVAEYIEKINEKYPEKDQRKHKHYFKDVSNLEYIDIYRVLSLWEVNDPCIQHAVKKLLVAGNRGYKDVQKDIQEAIESLERWKEMQKEDICQKD